MPHGALESMIAYTTTKNIIEDSKSGLCPELLLKRSTGPIAIQ